MHCELAAREESRIRDGCASALDLCRPLPFTTRNKPALGDFLREIVNFDGEKTGD